MWTEGSRRESVHFISDITAQYRVGQEKPDQITKIVEEYDFSFYVQKYEK